MSQTSPTAPVAPFQSGPPLQSPRSAKRPRPSDLHTPAQNNAAVGNAASVTPLTGTNNVDDPFQHEAPDDDDVDDDEDEAPRKGGDKKSGRRKIKIEFIQDKSRRHITFSKRKAGIMKKAYELSTLTGTQVLLLVVSETGLVYTFTTAKLQPLVTQPEGKNLIQACLNAPNGAPPQSGTSDPSAPGAPSDSPTRGRNQPGGISLGSPDQAQQSANSVLGSGAGGTADLDLLTGGPLDSPPLPGSADPSRPNKVQRKRAATDVSAQVDTKGGVGPNTSSPRSPNMARPGTGAGSGQYMYQPPYTGQPAQSSQNQNQPAQNQNQQPQSSPSQSSAPPPLSMGGFSYPSPTTLYPNYGPMGVYGAPPQSQAAQQQQQQQAQQAQQQQQQQAQQQRQGSAQGVGRAGPGSLSNWNSRR